MYVHTTHISYIIVFFRWDIGYSGIFLKKSLFMRVSAVSLLPANLNTVGSEGFLPSSPHKVKGNLSFLIAFSPHPAPPDAPPRQRAPSLQKKSPQVSPRRLNHQSINLYQKKGLLLHYILQNFAFPSVLLLRLLPLKMVSQSRAIPPAFLYFLLLSLLHFRFHHLLLKLY